MFGIIISQGSDFQGPGLKGNVHVAIFRKKKHVIALVPTYINVFFI